MPGPQPRLTDPFVNGAFVYAHQDTGAVVAWMESAPEWAFSSDPAQVIGYATNCALGSQLLSDGSFPFWIIVALALVFDSGDTDLLSITLWDLAMPLFGPS